MKHRSGMRKAILVCGSSMLIAIYTTGCNWSEHQMNADFFKPQSQPMNEFFPPPGQERDVERIQRIMAASGARNDATMQPYHFDKGELNSTGQQKLRYMLDDDDANNPITIYMNVPASDEEFKAARQDAIIAFLKEEGLEEKQIAFKPAPNMKSGGPAADAIARLPKLETGKGGSSSESKDGEGSSSGGGTSSGGSEPGMGK